MVSFSAYYCLSYKYMEIKWNCNNLPQIYLQKSNKGTIGWQSGIKKNWKFKAVCRHTAELPIPYLIIN